MIEAEPRKHPLGGDHGGGRRDRRLDAGSRGVGASRTEALRRTFGHAARLGRQTATDASSALAGFFVTRARRDEVPLVSLGGVLRLAQALFVESAEIVLAIDQAEISRAPEPLAGHDRVLGTALALDQRDAKVVHRVPIAALGGAFGPPARLGQVLGQSGFAVLVKLGEIELGRRMSEIGGLPQVFQPARRLGLDGADGIGIEGRKFRGLGGRHRRPHGAHRLRRDGYGGQRRGVGLAACNLTGLVAFEHREGVGDALGRRAPRLTVSHEIACRAQAQESRAAGHQQSGLQGPARRSLRTHAET